MPLSKEEMHVANEHRFTRLEVLTTFNTAALMYIGAIVTGHMLGFTVNGAFWLP
ncbi:MAG: hypothetical protein L3K18_09700 [Thermoplasmata archaeon]|nr:hypothetical protein [Thermoplasmata archaeon]